MAIAQRLTLEEFLELPEKKPALEYEEGVITQKMSPKGRHSVLQRAVMDRFDRAGKPGKLARAFPELRASWNRRSYVPDVSVYRWERIPRDDRGRVADDFFDPPDIAVEVSSPKQSIPGLIRKCLWYVDNGVPLSLLVAPDDESVFCFRHRQPLLTFRGDDIIDVSDVIPECRFTAKELFDSLFE